MQSHKEATLFKTKSFTYYNDLCMVFGKDCATRKNLETLADVVEQLENDEEINLDKDDLENINNMIVTNEVQSISYSEVSKVA